jgi:hypothetical protein
MHNQSGGSKNVKTRIYKTIILPVVLYGCCIKERTHFQSYNN